MSENITYKYQSLFNEIKLQIIQKNLKSNTKLDSIRKVAKKKNLSTTTVEKAYLQLLVEGYIYSVPKSGYFVSKIDDITYQDTKHIDSIETKNYQNNALTEDLFDMKTYKSIINKVINYHSDELLHECAPNGEEQLREEIRKYVLKERNVVCDKSQIVIGPGIQNLLQMLVSLKTYDTISYLTPGFQKALNIFSLHGYQSFSHNTIDNITSSNTDYLYISPSNIYPTGENLKIQDRIKLIKWAQDYHSYIIEDDYNFFIKYNNYSVPSIHSLDPNHVIYMGSFSKTLLPSIRISFMILPDSLYEIYQKQYLTFSQGVSKLEQLTLALYLKEGHFYKHTKKLYTAYKKKNELFQQYMSPYTTNKQVTLRGTESNLHVLIDFNTIESYNHFINICQSRKYKYSVIKEKETLLFPYSGIKNTKMESIISELFQTKGNH